MSTIKQYTSAGEAAADLTVDEGQLVLDKGAQALKDAVDAIRAGMRAGTASTLAKGEVAGSNKKPWKQKGTGNARAGFRQSPVWRGGGVAHGPHPRSFEKKVNRKVMALIKAHEPECVKAIAAKTGSFAVAERVHAFERFLNMLARGGWIPGDNPVKKALDASKKPPKPKAPNLRDL